MLVGLDLAIQVLNLGDGVVELVARAVKEWQLTERLRSIRTQTAVLLGRCYDRSRLVRNQSHGNFLHATESISAFKWLCT
jgi:hypothetical protein